MTARTHDAAALLALSVAVMLWPVPDMRLSTILVAVLANQLGGIAPDLDQPTAPLWRNLPEGRFLGKIFGRVVGGHRFLSHSVIGLVLFGVISKLLLNFLHPLMPHVDTTLVWYAFIIGVVSHLIMDTFTKEGVPWLLPVPVKLGLPPIKRLRITTGKHIEALIVFPLIILLVIWLCASHYNEITNYLQHRLIR